MRNWLFTAFFMALLALSGIYFLNCYTYYRYFEHISMKSSSVRFKHDAEEYAKNHHVSFDVDEIDGNYEFRYSFRDMEKKDWIWKWSYPVDITDEMILSFGIPSSIFEPYYPVDSVIKKRERILEEGLFIMEGNYVGPDLIGMINYYRPFLEPVSSLIENSLGGQSTWRKRVELAMKFTQDIPYSIPPAEQGEKYTGGVFPPPQLFVNTYGDCDSKVVMFTSILSYFDEYEILIMQETGHVLTGLKGIPKPYDKFYEYKNQKYIMAETAGPGRSNFGIINDPYKKINQVYLAEIY